MLDRFTADYEAWLAPTGEARDVIELGRRFVAAVEELVEEASQK